MIDCPVCGKDVTLNEYSYSDEMCYNCLKNDAVLIDNFAGATYDGGNTVWDGVDKWVSKKK